MRWRGHRRLAAVAGLLLWLPCGAFPVDRAGDARQDAMRFILEKLERQAGDVWDRSARYFSWRYRFTPEACELSVERSARTENAVYLLKFPLADAVPLADGPSSLRFGCLRGESCIAYEDRRRGEIRQGGLSSAALFVMESDDLPKLLSAFRTLHRLCDEPYGPSVFHQP